MKTKNSIVLIGMPGSGKSTTGKILAKALNWQFIDSDRLIQKDTHMPLQDYIDRYGESAFLSVENRVLEQLTIDQHVIAPGGSIIYHPELLKKWKESAYFVYLKTRSSTLEKRISKDSRGIVWHGAQNLDELLQNRVSLYEEIADLTLSSDDHHFDRIADEITRNFQYIK